MDKALERAFREVASPAYIFSAQAFTSRSEMVRKAFGNDTDICYSIKANPFLLAVLPDVFSKTEVCSPGELEICKALHVDPSKVIFSGVNKSLDEVRKAMDYGVIILTAESCDQLKHISTAASERGVTAEVLIRLSCESQFGMDKSDVFDVIANRDSVRGIDIKGIHYFTGTQKTRPKEIIRLLLIFFHRRYRWWLAEDKKQNQDLAVISMSIEQPDEAVEASRLIRSFADEYGVCKSTAYRVALCLEEMVAYVKRTRNFEFVPDRKPDVEIMVRFKDRNNAVFVSLDEGDCISLDKDDEKQRMITNNYGLIKKIAKEVEYQYILNLNYTRITIQTNPGS